MLPWWPEATSTIWVFAQQGGNSAVAGRWYLLTLATTDDHEAALVSAGYHVVGQLLDVSSLTPTERAELGDSLSKTSRERDRQGLAQRERELLAQVPRLSAPGIDLDHGIARYVVRGPDGTDLAMREVDTSAAQHEALRLAGVLRDLESQHGATLRLAWSGGPSRAGVHADRGLVEPGAATPLLLWALLERTRSLCAQAGVPTSELVRPRQMRKVAAELCRKGWPVRERVAGPVPTGERCDPIERHADQKLLVVAVDTPLTSEQVDALLDQVQKLIPPVWADLVPLNHHPGTRGRLFRPLGGQHKSWSPENPTAVKAIIDPSAPRESRITEAEIRPFLTAAQLRLAREAPQGRPSRTCSGPASPEAVQQVRRQRREAGQASDSLRDLTYDAALPRDLAEEFAWWASAYGPEYVRCTDRTRAALGITGVLAGEGVAAELAGDLVYLAALAGGMSDQKAVERGEHADRAARGVLEGDRPAGGLGLVREAVGDEGADDLAELAARLAGAEGRELLRQLPGRLELDARATGEDSILDALTWAREHDRETYMWLQHELRGHGVWRDMLRFARQRAEVRRREQGLEDDRYVEQDGRLYAVSQTDQGAIRQLLANFTARITAEVEEDDGSGELRRAYEVEATLDHGQVKTCRVPAAKFDSMDWVAPELGARAVIEPGRSVRDMVRHALQVLSAPEPKRLYTHLGWTRTSEGWAYLHVGGAIGAQGATSGVEVALSDAVSRFVLPPPPTGEELRRAVRASLGVLRVATHRITLPLWASVYRAALGEARFGVFVVGTTGCRKSCLTALAQQHYGADMAYDALPCSWEATANALEGIAFLAKDALLVVDDFRPRGSRTEQDRLQAAADRLFRSQANHAARLRMRDDLSHRAARPPRGLVLSSGEELPVGSSLRARLVIVRLGADEVALDVLSRCQADAEAGLYSRALAGFVRWLAPQYQSVSDALRSDLAALRPRFTIAGAHGRTPEAMAELLLGTHYFARFAAELGALDAVEAERLKSTAEATLRDLASEQAEVQSESDPVQRFFASLRAVLSSGAAHLAGAGDRVPQRDPASLGWRREDEGSERARDQGRTAADTPTVWRSQGPRLGWIKGDDVYLLPDPSLAVVRRGVEASGEAWSTTERALGLMLAERGLLRSRESTRTTVRVPRSLTGARHRTWHVSAGQIGMGPEVST